MNNEEFKLSDKELQKAIDELSGTKFLNAFCILDWILKTRKENQELKEHCEKQRYAIIENCDLRKKILKLEDVLDEIREYIENNRLFNFVPDEEELFEYASDGKAKSELLQILDKANEQKW